MEFLRLLLRRRFVRASSGDLARRRLFSQATELEGVANRRCRREACNRSFLQIFLLLLLIRSAHLGIFGCLTELSP